MSINILKKRVLGYQIESTDGKHEIPDCFWSFEFLSNRSAEWFLSQCNYSVNGVKQWMKVPIFSGDIENPKRVSYKEIRSTLDF